MLRYRFTDLMIVYIALLPIAVRDYDFSKSCDQLFYLNHDFFSFSFYDPAMNEIGIFRMVAAV